VQSRGRTFSRV